MIFFYHHPTYIEVLKIQDLYVKILLLLQLLLVYKKEIY